MDLAYKDLEYWCIRFNKKESNNLDHGFYPYEANELIHMEGR